MAIISALSTAIAIRQRYRRSTGTLREQMRLLVLVAAAAGITSSCPSGVSITESFFTSDSELPAFYFFFLALVLILLVGTPGAYLVAIFRHGLWDTGLVIRKTVQYGVVVVAFMVVGFLIVAVVPTVVIGVGGADFIPTFIFAAALAACFLWLRPRASRLADRLVYGKRATPYEVLSEFSERVGETYSTDDVLPRMAQLLVQATGATRADVWLRVGHETASRSDVAGRRPGGVPEDDRRQRSVTAGRGVPHRGSPPRRTPGRDHAHSACRRSDEPREGDPGPRPRVAGRPRVAQRQAHRGAPRVATASGGGAGRGAAQARTQHP